MDIILEILKDFFINSQSVKYLFNVWEDSSENILFNFIISNKFALKVSNFEGDDIDFELYSVDDENYFHFLGEKLIGSLDDKSSQEFSLLILSHLNHQSNVQKIEWDLKDNDWDLEILTEMLNEPEEYFS